MISRLVGDEKLFYKVMMNIKKQGDDIALNLFFDIDQYVLRLRKSTTLSTVDKFIFFVEAAFLLATAFLAGRWSIDPTGNYEPYIVMLGVLVPLLEIARRLWKRSAT